jgi:hypothetical protein
MERRRAGCPVLSGLTVAFDDEHKRQVTAGGRASGRWRVNAPGVRSGPRLSGRRSGKLRGPLMDRSLRYRRSAGDLRPPVQITIDPHPLVDWNWIGTLAVRE